MIRTGQDCEGTHDTVESSHRAVVTLCTLLSSKCIKLPLNVPVFERPEQQHELNGLPMS